MFFKAMILIIMIHFVVVKPNLRTAKCEKVLEPSRGIFACATDKSQ